MKAIVLCAGRGTRLGGLTAGRPKAMLPVADRPLLAWILAWLARHDIGDVAINLCHHGAQIEDHFGSGKRHGVRLHYSHETEPLGTAGAVRQLAPWLAGEGVLVVYGDILTNQDLALLFQRHRALSAFATLLLHRREGSNSLITLDATGRIEAFVERPSAEERERFIRERPGAEVWVNSGVQILSAQAVGWISTSSAFDLPAEVYRPLCSREVLAGQPLSGFRVAVDSPERLAAAGEAARAGLLGPMPADILPPRNQHRQP